eukprot:892469-Ditylum_brightwellii.AAC.1
MRFYWVHNRCVQGHFLVYWGPGKDNLGDYHTKHHSTAHHQRMRPMYLHTAYGAFLSMYTNPCSLQGCVESGKIQPTRAGNPERSIANNNTTKRTQSILGCPECIIISSDMDTEPMM